jgi:hypothetical protein
VNIFLSKVLAFAFWRLREFFRAVHDDGYSEWKAFAVICCAQICGITGLVFGIFVVLKRPVKLPAEVSPWAFAIILSSVVVAANHYLLRLDTSWAQFKAEFEAYSARSQMVGSVLTFAAVILLAVFGLLTASLVSRFR